MSSSCEAVTRGGRGRSRHGCRNCKLRKLKCDESKPHCKRCLSFRVMCNFIPGTPDLEPVASAAPRSRVAKAKTRLRSPPSSAIWTSDASTFYLLNSKCQHFITQYLGRSLTTTTPGDPNMVQVNRKLLELAFTHPYLMHASLAVAYSYDRHLNGSTGNRRTLEECYHWSQGTKLLNTRLQQAVTPEDRDSIWGTAAALAVLGFSSPDASTPDESWPMKFCDSSDLDWLSLSKGKMSLWHKVNPLRSESIFSVMGDTYGHMFAPLPGSGRDGVPYDLAAICSLDDTSTPENNAYFHAVHALSQILKLPDDEVTTGQTQLFTRSIEGHFESFLIKRDPVAILLLYMWYRKVRRSIWWIELRARVEMPSICMYLRTYHANHHALQSFLSEGPSVIS